MHFERISYVEEKDREERRKDLGEENDKRNETELETIGEKGPEKIMDLGRFQEGQ